MEYVILGLLMIEPMTLYTLNKAFEQGISLFFSPSLGSINSASKKLLVKGYVTQEEMVENGRVKKVFTITPEGKNAFLEWMSQPLDPKNLEVGFLSRLYFMGLIDSDVEKRRIVSEMYQTAKASKEQLDQIKNGFDITQVPEAYQQTFKYQMKVLDYGIDTHRYALSWIEDLMKEMS